MDQLHQLIFLFRFYKADDFFSKFIWITAYICIICAVCAVFLLAASTIYVLCFYISCIGISFVYVRFICIIYICIILICIMLICIRALRFGSLIL